MSSAVADLETNLQAMLALKPPGVSGSRISAVTSLCIANVQVWMMPSSSWSNPRHWCPKPSDTNDSFEFSPSQSSSRGFSPTSRKLLAPTSSACSTL